MRPGLPYVSARVKFHRIYVELTNACGLRCSFCPSATTSPQHMSLPLFETVVAQARAYTREIACHVVGDPLMRADLGAYLDVIHAHGMKAILTTSGYFLKKHPVETLFHPCVKQINVSLNAFNRNDTRWTFDQYLAPVLALCRENQARNGSIFVNLRVWNLDQAMSEHVFNAMLFARLEREFDVALDLERVYRERPQSIRLAAKVLLHFDAYFEWPSMDNPVYGDGRCLGLSSHVAVLSNGTVVPCCLDYEGVMALGDLQLQRLDDILRSERAQSIVNGFREGRAVEALCQRCSYKSRFDGRDREPVGTAE